MCTEIQIKGGERLERMGDLWSLVGREKVVLSHDAEFSADDCLCHVEVPATADLAGYDCRSGWDDACIDFIWERKSNV